MFTCRTVKNKQSCVIYNSTWALHVIKQIVVHNLPLSYIPYFHCYYLKKTQKNFYWPNSCACGEWYMRHHTSRKENLKMLIVVVVSNYVLHFKALSWSAQKHANVYFLTNYFAMCLWLGLKINLCIYTIGCNLTALPSLDLTSWLAHAVKDLARERCTFFL